MTGPSEPVLQILNIDVEGIGEVETSRINRSTPTSNFAQKRVARSILVNNPNGLLILAYLSPEKSNGPPELFELIDNRGRYEVRHPPSFIKFRRVKDRELRRCDLARHKKAVVGINFPHVLSRCSLAAFELDSKTQEQCEMLTVTTPFGFLTLEVNVFHGSFVRDRCRDNCEQRCNDRSYQRLPMLQLCEIDRSPQSQENRKYCRKHKCRNGNQVKALVHPRKLPFQFAVVERRVS